MEEDVVKPTKPQFSQCFAEDINMRRKKDQDDQLYYKMKNYHKNIELTTETNLSNFLDTKMNIKDGHYNTEEYRKETTYWSSKVSERYKRNSIKRDLHCSKKLQQIFKKKLHQFVRNFSKQTMP